MLFKSGREPGALFNKGIDEYDPLKDTSSLPGKDGSDEKIAALQQRIQDRVDQLKKSGEWGEDGDSFGADPLAKQSVFQTMAMQIKACKPFDSIGELFLTYFLVLGTTAFMLVYLTFLKGSLEGAMQLFIGTDFDSDVLEGVMKNIPA